MTAAPAILLLYPALTRLTEAPGFMAAAAADYWLAAARPWLDIPDMVRDEDKHWARLHEALPELEEFDLQLGPGGEGVADEAKFYARKARRGAIRTIAVGAGLGTPTFAHHPLLGGDAFIRFSPAPGLTCRIGRAASMSWRPSPSAVAKAVAVLNTPAVVALVERALFPLLTAPADNYQQQFSRWSALSPLRDWEESHRFPLVARRALLPATPASYELRYAPEEATALGVPPIVAAKLVSPYAAAIVRTVREKVAREPAPANELLEWVARRAQVSEA